MPVPNYTPAYDIESPYRNTPIVGNFMAYYVHRSIEPQDDDILIPKMDNPRYNERPDLLSDDLYGTPDLWWVFAVRNGFEDPMFDLKMGVELYIPSKEYLRRIL